MSASNNRHPLLCIEKQRPLMGASRTTIPSTGGKVCQQYLSHNRPCEKLTQKHAVLLNQHGIFFWAKSQTELCNLIVKPLDERHSNVVRQSPSGEESISSSRERRISLFYGRVGSRNTRESLTTQWVTECRHTLQMDGESPSLSSSSLVEPNSPF